MVNIHEQKCPKCSGPLRFDPKKGKLICDYCDSEFDVDKTNTGTNKEAKQDIMEGFDFESLMTKASSQDSRDLPIYVCKSCGAEIIATTESFSMICPFCQNNVVLTDKISGNMRPDGIIPFKITKDVLPDYVNNYYKDMKFLPKNFFSHNTMGKVTGIYVPFWVFNGKAEGNVIYTGEKSAGSSRNGDYITETYDVYKLSRDVSLEFKDVPIDASEKMDDELMDSMEPFDMSECKKFDYGYLAGYAADRFDVPAKNIAERAEKRMCNTAASLAKRKVAGEYSSISYLGSNLKAKLDAKYILMPIYQFNLEFDGKEYNFAVNGQTGKIIGRLPYDKGRKAIYFAVRAVGLFFAALLLFIIKYFLGR